jgi:cell division protein FtsB
MKNVINKTMGWAAWGLIFLLSLNLIKDITRAKGISARIAAEEAKLSKIEADNAKLESELLMAKSPDFIEREVRNKLGLARENEAIVVLPDAETLKKLAPDIKNDTESLPDPNWKKWTKLFF